MKRVACVLIVMMLSGIAYGTEAQTEARISNQRYGVLVDFGFGGSFSQVYEYKGEKYKYDHNYALTKGISFYSIWQFNDIVSIGIDARLLLWNEEDDDLNGTSYEKTVDISPIIRLQNRFDDKFLGFIKFAPGFSIYIPSEDYDESNSTITNGYGYNIPFLLGFELALSKNVSMISEVGYMNHIVYGKIKGKGEYEGINPSYKIDGGQYFFNTGLTF